MSSLYQLDAPKKSANLSINSDLLNKAKELGINLSATLEYALAESVREKQRALWIAENKDAMDAYSRHVEENGVFSDSFRSF